MKTRNEWNQIYTAANATKETRTEMMPFVDSAWTNASETDGVVFESDEFFVMCFASLEGLLCDTDAPHAHKFFSALGVRF
jgi:hypothetical protein